MQKTDVLLNISVETMIHFYQDSLMNRKLKKNIDLKWKCINIFTVTLDQFNASLLNKSINLFKNFSSSVYRCAYLQHTGTSPHGRVCSVLRLSYEDGKTSHSVHLWKYAC